MYFLCKKKDWPHNRLVTPCHTFWLVLPTWEILDPPLGIFVCLLSELKPVSSVPKDFCCPNSQAATKYDRRGLFGLLTGRYDSSRSTTKLNHFVDVFLILKLCYFYSTKVVDVLNVLLIIFSVCSVMAICNVKCCSTYCFIFWYTSKF